jgi:anaerobic ribonucleoside-triphosphate reductase
MKGVEKRDGSVVPFDRTKIVDAVDKAMRSAQEGSRAEAEKVAGLVCDDIGVIAKKYKNFIPTVEGIQDSVEKELVVAQYAKTAKAYIL